MLIVLFTIFSLLTLTQPVFAETLTEIENRKLNSTECVETINGSQVVTLDCVPVLFANFIYWFLMFAGVVTLFLIIFSGFKFMTSGGDPKSVEAAKKTLTWAIIGISAVLFSFAILAFVSQAVGVDCFKSIGFNACQYTDP